MASIPAGRWGDFRTVSLFEDLIIVSVGTVFVCPFNTGHNRFGFELLPLLLFLLDSGEECEGLPSKGRLCRAFSTIN